MKEERGHCTIKSGIHEEFKSLRFHFNTSTHTACTCDARSVPAKSTMNNFPTLTSSLISFTRLFCLTATCGVDKAGGAHSNYSANLRSCT